MIISLIAALAKDRIIGINNTIPWHLSADLAWFKHNTLNKPVIMGHRTLVSIGKPLLKRLNIVLSKHVHNTSHVIWVTTPMQALVVAGTVPEVMVIGGGKVYETFLPYAKRLYLTHIDAKVNGDTWFPEYKHYKWQVIFKKSCMANKENSYNYCFEVLER